MPSLVQGAAPPAGRRIGPRQRGRNRRIMNASVVTHTPWRASSTCRPSDNPTSGVPAMGLDGLAAAAYGPEAALTVLIPTGAGLANVAPLTAAILGLLAVPVSRRPWRRCRTLPACDPPDADSCPLAACRCAGARKTTDLDTVSDDPPRRLTPAYRRGDPTRIQECNTRHCVWSRAA
jgi:hypothetical protein